MEGRKVTSSSNEIYMKLSTLVEDKKHHNEKECREYLPVALSLFVPYSGHTTILDNESEYPGHTGPSDLIIFCERTSGGVSEKYAYIWEVKSPQTNVFVEDTQNRVKPSPEFVQAENQLLHYWYDCKTEQFRKEFSLTSIDNVLLGGILIGNGSTLVKGGYEESKKRRLYRTALNLRKECFYGRDRIQVLIWDDVLAFLKPPELRTGEKTGTVVDVTISDSTMSRVGSSEPQLTSSPAQLGQTQD